MEKKGKENVRWKRDLTGFVRTIPLKRSMKKLEATQKDVTGNSSALLELAVV